MTMHAIRMPDRMRGRELRTIRWDDEAGTVDGDHWHVPWLQELLARKPPVLLGSVPGALVLHDPGRDPRDFLALLGVVYWPILAEPDPDGRTPGDRHRLPPALRRVEPTRIPAPPEENDYGRLEDGTRVYSPVLY